LWDWLKSFVSEVPVCRDTVRALIASTEDGENLSAIGTIDEPIYGAIRGSER